MTRRAARTAAAIAVLGLAAAGAGAAGPARAADAAPSAPPLAARAAALYAPQTGQTLLGAAAHRRLAIASTTKLMTALVVLEHVRDLDSVYTFPDYLTDADDSQIGLRPGERMTVRDLLVAMMLPSADDAAQDLASGVGHGSVARFVAMMNQTARRLGLHDTHYTTPIGLDTPGNYSSAADLVRLAAYDLAHEPFFARTVARPSAALATGPVRVVANRNDLVARHPWIDGVKTGHTSDAGYVLVAAGRRHGLRLVSAVLGTSSEAARDGNTMALLDYGFGSFALTTPVRARQVLARPAVTDRPGVHVAVRAARGFARVLPRSLRTRVVVSVPRRLRGPLPAGAVVGHATVRAGSRTLATIPVVVPRRLTAVSQLTLFGRWVTQTWVLALIAMLAASSLGALAVRAGWVGARRRRPGTGAAA